MKVERIHLNGDLGVVNAARVSFGKQKTKLDESDYKLIDYLKKHNHWTPFAHPQVICLFPLDDDIRDIMTAYADNQELFAGIRICENYVRFSKYAYDQFENSLPEHAICDIKRDFNDIELNKEHGLVWNYGLKNIARIPYMQFRIKCPLFVYMQLAKHQVGMVINQVSRRYVKSEPEFWEPEKWRKQSPSNKQGSLKDEFVEEVTAGVGGGEEAGYHNILSMIVECWYNENIKNGMCAEQARAILPVSTYTEFVWTGSLADFTRVVKLRDKDDAQEETREIARMIKELCLIEYPMTFAKLLKVE